MAYVNARALASAIQGQARAGAGPTALNEFFAQRLIARVARAFPDRWALKGGHAMVARLPDVARTTKDVDCALRSASRDTAIAELERAVKAEPDDRDFLEFELMRAKPGIVDDLASLTFRVRFGGKDHGNVKLDVQVVRARHELGESVPLRRRVDPPGQDGWPEQIPVTPVADHMAEKLVALYSVHDGRPSSRERDLIDLALLATFAPPQPHSLDAALDRAMGRPVVPSVEVALPPRFEPPERFRAAFERHPHTLSWGGSMARIDEVTARALTRRAAMPSASDADDQGGGPSASGRDSS